MKRSKKCRIGGGTTGNHLIFIKKPVVSEKLPSAALPRDFYAESGHTLDCAVAESSFRALLHDDSLGAAFIARFGIEPVGYAVVTFRFSMASGGYDALLDDMFVIPGARRQGIGSGLVDAVLSHCSRRVVRLISVEAAVGETEATRLYRRFGFRESTLSHLIRDVGVADVREVTPT